MDGGSGVGRFGSSLKVDNVQTLAAKLSSEIPERYVRPERKHEVVLGGAGEVSGEVSGEDSGESILVIDFSKLFDSNYSDEEEAKLHSACEGWGFFQLINHGIPEDVMNNLRQDIEEFFKLPLEEKEKVAQSQGQIEGYGQAFVHSEEQKLDWGDMLFLGTFPSTLKQLQFWPTNPPTCRETIDEYAKELKRVAHGLLKKMSKNLKLESEKLYEMFKGGIQSLRFNYYPLCSNPEKVLGLSPHSDANGLTLLLQINESQGLQIKRNGRWLQIKAMPRALIVNIGDTIEILTNGKYKSIEHRGVVNKEKERLSVAAFHSLSIGDIVGPMSEIVKGQKLLYKSLQYEEFVKQFLANKLEGKSMSDRMKLD